MAPAKRRGREGAANHMWKGGRTVTRAALARAAAASRFFASTRLAGPGASSQGTTYTLKGAAVMSDTRTDELRERVVGLLREIVERALCNEPIRENERPAYGQLFDSYTDRILALVRPTESEGELGLWCVVAWPDRGADGARILHPSLSDHATARDCLDRYAEDPIPGYTYTVEPVGAHPKGEPGT